MYRKIFLMLACLTSAWIGRAQELIVNGDFEATETKGLKGLGMLQTNSAPWFYATDAACDIYARGVKSDDVGVPENAYGNREPVSGDSYAGFCAYAKDSKKVRTYMQIEFSEPMVKDRRYCIKMEVSLAGLSKYAVNHIGMHVSKRRLNPSNVTEVDDKVNTIIAKANPVIKENEAWTTICGIYTSRGDEEYLTIGCFTPDNDLKIEKAVKPRGVMGSPSYDAYYFVDDVSVMGIDNNIECSCAMADQVREDIIYSRSVSFSENMSIEEVFNASDVYFASLKSDFNAEGARNIDQLVIILEENPQIQFTLVGHCDNDEMQEGVNQELYRDIAQKRADKVKAYLVAKGINAMRIKTASKDNTVPANTRPTPLSMAQNRRVQFVLN